MTSDNSLSYSSYKTNLANSLKQTCVSFFMLAVIWYFCYVTFLPSCPFICIFMSMLELTCMIYYLLSLKVTSKQLNSHGDGGHPAFGDDSDKAGENGRVDVVPGVAVVICISHKNLDLM